LNELKRVAEKKGYVAAAYKLLPQHLYKLNRPVIVYLEPGGKKHFSVLKKVKGDKVYLADPAKGNIRIELYRFLEE